MIERYFETRKAHQHVVIAFSLVIAILLGALMSRFEFGIREFVIFLFGVVALTAVLMPTDAVLRIGLGVGIASIGMGWRTLALTQNLVFSAFEVIIWALAAVLVVRSILRREQLYLDFSLPFVVFVILCGLAIVRGLPSEVPWDQTVGFGKQVLLVAPFFLVMRNLVRDTTTWKHMVYVAAGTGLYLALTGLLVFLLPEEAKPLGNLLGAESFQTENFNRAGFPGWGPLAAWFFVPLFGLLLGFWNSARERYQQIVFLSMLFVLGAAILVSGQRGAWVALLAGMVVYALFDLRRGLVLTGIILFLILVIPEQSVTVRFASAFDPTLFDTSAVDRYDRINRALSALEENPLLGLGFGVQTYVHSDYLEIGAAMGVFAVGLFVLALGSTGRQLLRTCRSSFEDLTRKMSHGVFVMFVILVVELLSAGFVTLSFTAVVMWFFWAMADQYAVIVQNASHAIPGDDGV